MSEAPARFRFGRFLGVAALTTALLTAAGFVWARSAGTGARAAMLLGCWIPFVASILAAVPLLWPAAKPAGAASQFLASMGVRLMAVGLLAFAAGRVFEPPTGPFVGWLLVAYLALLAVDTAFVVKLFRSL